MPSRSNRLSLFAAVLWAVLVAVALLAPGGLAVNELDWPGWLPRRGGDKLVHLALFFGQAFWLSRAFGEEEHSGARRWWAAVVAALYGLILEGAQLAVPGRGFEVADIVANILGALLWPLLSLFAARR